MTVSLRMTQPRAHSALTLTSTDRPGWSTTPPGMEVRSMWMGTRRVVVVNSTIRKGAGGTPELMLATCPRKERPGYLSTVMSTSAPTSIRPAYTTLLLMIEITYDRFRHSTSKPSFFNSPTKSLG